MTWSYQNMVHLIFSRGSELAVHMVKVKSRQEIVHLIFTEPMNLQHDVNDN